MRRNNLIKRNGKIVQSTNYQAVPAESPSDIWLITQDGDRLDLLAEEYYGSYRNWWFICQVNDLKPNIAIEAGVKLRIPRLMSMRTNNSEGI